MGINRNHEKFHAMHTPSYLGDRGEATWRPSFPAYFRLDPHFNDGHPNESPEFDAACDHDLPMETSCCERPTRAVGMHHDATPHGSTPAMPAETPPSHLDDCEDATWHLSFPAYFRLDPRCFSDGHPNESREVDAACNQSFAMSACDGTRAMVLPSRETPSPSASLSYDSAEDSNPGSSSGRDQDNASQILTTRLAAGAPDHDAHHLNKHKAVAILPLQMWLGAN